MPNSLEPAATGRSKCRACGRTIGKGELRFGEALPNPFGEGEAMFWFHVPCAACMRPESSLATLEANADRIPDATWILKAARAGLEHPKLARLAHAERSSSGRARCRHCQELIAKDALRIALSMFEEGRFSPMGFLHASCAAAYFATKDLLERIVRLTPDLAEADRVELAAEL